MEKEKRRIKDIEEYYVLLAELELLCDAEMGTFEGYRLEELTEMLDSFEKEMFPIGGGSARTGGRF